MYDFLALKVKCPICSKSLMDKQVLVDNESSIKLNIEIGEKKGIINLSSIYGSYNYSTDIEMLTDEIAKFTCPHCTALVLDESTCLSCDAPMVPFYLDMGGKVSICSRSGCKQHKVEFDDLSVALNKLYQEYGLAGNYQEKVKSLKRTNETVDSVKETIESGSFLQAYCPHCKKSLIENEQIKLKIKNGKNGFIMLSPYLNVFTLKSTISLPEDKTVGDLLCFHCNESLVKDEKNCETCNSPTIKIAISARTKLLDFYICTKKGCKWHGLSEKDYYDIRLEDSLEW
jgi:hypothetical protein